MAIDKNKTELIKAKWEELTGTLSDPAIASRPDEYTKYSRELASLNPQVEAIQKYESCEKEIAGILELLESGDLNGDDEMRSLANAELSDAKDLLAELEKELVIYLTPGDPRDSRSVILEIRAGAGGEAGGQGDRAQGGTGEALVELTVDLISNTEATISAVPNSEVAEYHYGFITVDYYNEIGEEAAADVIREDGFPAYEPESFTWTNLEPSVYYYALGTAKNINDEWGATTLVEVFTDIDGVAESVNTYAVYPNPANDFITVSGEGLNKVSVYNALGQMIDEFVTEGAECKIATASYENGIYFLKVNNGAAVRFVVTH